MEKKNSNFPPKSRVFDLTHFLHLYMYLLLFACHNALLAVRVCNTTIYNHSFEFRKLVLTTKKGACILKF